MSHGCFISYKKEDRRYLEVIARRLKELGIPCSFLDKTINSDNIDTVISVLRQNYMNNKPVTLFLIGTHSYEDTKARWMRTQGPYWKHDEYNEQSFIIRELRATLSNYDGNPRHGVVGIVLPEMTDKIYLGESTCPICGQTTSIVAVNDETVVREFWKNYYLVPENENCSHYGEDGRFCILCKFEDFMENPNKYIDAAYEKTKSRIAEHVYYKNIQHDYKLRDE